MSTQRIADMTLDELENMINEVVGRRLRGLLKPPATRTMAEVNESIRRNRIVPPPGAKSARELLREDRDAP